MLSVSRGIRTPCRFSTPFRGGSTISAPRATGGRWGLRASAGVFFRRQSVLGCPGGKAPAASRRGNAPWRPPADGALPGRERPIRLCSAVARQPAGALAVRKSVPSDCWAGRRESPERGQGSGCGPLPEHGAAQCGLRRPRPPLRPSLQQPTPAGLEDRRGPRYRPPRPKRGARPHAAGAVPRRRTNGDPLLLLRRRRNRPPHSAATGATASAAAAALSPPNPPRRKVGVRRRPRHAASRRGRQPGASARRHPHISGGVYELPQVRPFFEEYVNSFGLSDRLSFHGGDFFVGDLPGADVIVLGQILHGWGLEEKLLLLRKAYQALPDGARCSSTTPSSTTSGGTTRTACWPASTC
ncbi:methyltransferase [Streptomyces sparsogenes]|uniref:methyltransferase n=1 Tax=Streptomyces sparsogenes TaxID=67365 RepID=UPI00384F3132